MIQMMIELAAAPLTRDAFADFGDVIETHGHEPLIINEGTTQRFHDLAKVDVLDAGGAPLISIFRATPRPLPIAIKLMERHPHGSQAFMPLSDQPFLVVVAGAGDVIEPENLKAFVTNGAQGVSYAKNVWHHPILALGQVSDFLVVDRGPTNDNLQEYFFVDQDVIVQTHFQ